MTPCRDGRMQIAQRLNIIQPVDLRHHACEQVENALRLGNESRETLAPVHAGRRGVFIDQLGGAGARLFWRHVLQREVVAALEVAATFFERRAALLVHQPRQRLGEVRVRITCRRTTLGFDEHRPAGAEPAQCVVQPRRGGDQLALRRAVEIRAAKACRALERTVLVQHDAGRHQPGPGQPVGEQRWALTVFSEI